MPLALAVVLLSESTIGNAAESDPRRGSKEFRNCIACHSMSAGEHLTGPSLHDVFGRKAGTAPGFRRYSPALKSSGVVWNTETLDAWLADPERLVPNSWMAFAGLKDAQARVDLIAFLRTSATDGQAADKEGTKSQARPRTPDLKKAPPESIVKSIRYCADAYTVGTASGREMVIWEFNLRLKTDSSARGPMKGQPVLLRAGMQGDRTSVIFSDPAEISAFIRTSC
ncbi:MAG TPA: c-type cytochrome [Burkholderiales bacterium]|nr:c-type cytochrome [Burkholderiales bacterium]